MEEFNNKIDSTEFHSQSKEARIRFLSDLIQNKNTSSRVLEWAGFLALENEQWLIAENIFSSLLERRKKIIDLVGLAKALFKQSRFDEAEECYLAAIDKITEPCSLLFIVYKSLGEIQLLKKNFSMAEEYYNKASTLNPHCENLTFDRAMMYLKEKNYKEAEYNFQTFIKSNLSSTKAWLGLALVRKALGDEELALSCLQRCLDFDSNNYKALNLKQQWQALNFPQNISTSSKKTSLSEAISNPLDFSV